MYNKITSGKQLQIELSELREQLSQLTTPTHCDTQNIAAIYQFIIHQPQIDRREIRHCFVIITVYLYSPISLFGHFPIKAGLCHEMGEIMNCGRQKVSEIFSQAKFRYENIPSFREQVETIFEQIEK